MDCNLEVFTSDYAENTCDGCGGYIPVGEKYITGIDSCCGECWRTLCRNCVETAYFKLLEVTHESN